MRVPLNPPWPSMATSPTNPPPGREQAWGPLRRWGKDKSRLAIEHREQPYRDCRLHAGPALQNCTQLLAAVVRSLDACADSGACGCAGGVSARTAVAQLSRKLNIQKPATTATRRRDRLIALIPKRNRRTVKDPETHSITQAGCGQLSIVTGRFAPNAPGCPDRAGPQPDVRPHCWSP